MFSVKPVKVKKVKSKNRFINSSIPAPGTAKILKSLARNEVRSMHGQLPIVWKKAKNFNIYDIKNNKFIDFTSTIFVANIGHSNSNLKKNLIKIINSNLINTYAYPNTIREKYLSILIKFCGNGFEKAFLLSSGSEAIEASIKIIRLNAIKSNKGFGILTVSGNWHGRTMGSQLLSDNLEQSKWIRVLNKEIYHLRFPYPWLLKKLNKTSTEILNEDLKKLSENLNIAKDISGVILETFQGWGALFYPKEYVQILSRFCKKYKILLVFDEIQAGFGRTGKKFGFEHYGVRPDMICCGKGIGGGLPLSALIGKKRYLDQPGVGTMSSTYSANPISCIAGVSVIDEIRKKNLIYASYRKGLLLNKGLVKIKNKFKDLVEMVSCKGLLAAIIFKKVKKDKTKKLVGKVCEKCMQKGLLVVYTGRESIKLGPPLTISKSAIQEALSVIEDSIEEVFLIHKKKYK
jgi:4-aminobutyrate aminotransferase-like enzyme